MTQQQTIQLFLPILILLPVLYFRLRRMTKAQPLKLGQLWLRPAIILAVTALALLAPPPGQHVVRHLLPQDWAWLALAAVLGAVGGWYWGRTMAIEVHPENGTLMVSGGQAAILVLVMLILLRPGPARRLGGGRARLASGRAAAVRRLHRLHRRLVHGAQYRNVYPGAACDGGENWRRLITVALCESAASRCLDENEPFCEQRAV